MEEKVCLEENFERVRENIRRACERSGRSQDSVTLIAVSKFKPVSMIREAMACGQKVFGENRVQELCDKIEEIGPGVSWHMIGHFSRIK